MRRIFFKSKKSAKEPEHVRLPMQLLPRDVLLYLLNFFNGTDAIHFEISLGSQRKNLNEKSLLEQYAGKNADKLKFNALAHAALVLLEKLNEKIERESLILTQKNSLSSSRSKNFPVLRREDVLKRPFSSLIDVSQLSESVPFERIIRHFKANQITVGKMHDLLFDFIARETARGTYTNYNHCLLFKKTPAEAREEQEQESRLVSVKTLGPT